MHVAGSFNWWSVVLQMSDMSHNSNLLIIVSYELNNDIFCLAVAVFMSEQTEFSAIKQRNPAACFLPCNLNVRLKHKYKCVHLSMKFQRKVGALLLRNTP